MPSPQFKYLPDYTGMFKTVRPVPGYGVMLPEVTVTARTRNRNADGSPMTRADIRRAVDAARNGYGVNGARDFGGRVMSPEEQRVTHMARTRPDYEGLDQLVQFGLGFCPGWAAGIEGPVGFIDDALRYGYKGFNKLMEPRPHTEQEMRADMVRPFWNQNTLGFTF